MHWRDSLLKSEQVKWRRPPVKNIKDGKLDILITLPLTALFEVQAQRAFGDGMLAMATFQIKMYEANKVPQLTDFVKLFEEVGLPGYAEQLAKRGNE